jgi:hypothetical protein
MRAHSLEDLQDKYSTFRRRAFPGESAADFLAVIGVAVDRLEYPERHDDPADTGAQLGGMLIALCCLAQAERLDLAHHARLVYEQMRRDYEAGE